MSHEEALEELPLYAAGVLEPEAAETVRAHVEACEACRQTLQDLEGTLDMLIEGTIIPDDTDHARMRNAFVTLLREESHDRVADTGPVANPNRSAQVPALDMKAIRRKPSGGREGTRPLSHWIWPAAWAATALVALTGWLVVYHDQGALQRSLAMTYVATRGQARPLSPRHDKTARVTLYVGRDSVLVDVVQLPKLLPHQVYEGWWIRGTKATPAGTFRSGPHLLARRFGADAFAITVEPTGGTSKPTTPVLALTTV